MKSENEMRLCLEAGYSLVGLETNDDMAADKLLQDSLEGYASDIWEYDNARGGVNYRTKAPIDGSGEILQFSPRGDCVSMLAAFFDRVITDCRPVDCVMILRDVNEQLKDPQIVARIKAIANLNSEAKQRSEKYSVRVVVVSSAVDVPAELLQVATVVSMDPPDAGVIAELVTNFVESNGLVCDDGVKADLVAALKGLTESCVQRVLSYVKAKRGEQVDNGFVEDVRAEKARLVRNNGLLETVDVRGVDCSAGGMENLMAFIGHVALIFGHLKDAVEYGVDLPKGILIAGMPGCGKSLAAKAAAKTFGIPLVRLDMGRLMGKYVGESERKLREALAVAEAASPCVLWIDEIEKAFAGIGSSSDGGTATRLFGHFLTWMSEKKSPVYTIATANDVTNLPPELMRRGRFDELFSVDLPNEAECREILAVHLKRRGHVIDDAAMDEIAGMAARHGYAGADVESLVRTAVELAFASRMAATAANDPNWDMISLDLEDLRTAGNLIHSVTETMGEKIEALREKLEKFCMIPASNKCRTQGRRC
ncbi:MAG: AAA family ATPase [bacterium]|nr:AAA family ATPase [bacterium]